MQSAALVGIYGLTLFAVLIFAAPLVLVAGAARAVASARFGWRPAIATLPLLLLYGFGAWRLSGAPRADARWRAHQDRAGERRPARQVEIGEAGRDLRRSAGPVATRRVGPARRPCRHQRISSGRRRPCRSCRSSTPRRSAPSASSCPTAPSSSRARCG